MREEAGAFRIQPLFPLPPGRGEEGSKCGDPIMTETIGANKFSFNRWGILQMIACDNVVPG
jgi:hypothetical protein